MIAWLTLWLSVSMAGERIKCGDIISEVERFGADDVVRHLGDVRYKVTPSLVRCLERADLPATVVQAARARIDAAGGTGVPMARHTLDVLTAGWPTEFGQLLARRIAQMDPGTAPFAMRVTLEADVADWYLERLDEAAAAVLSAIPDGSRAMEAPDVLADEADGFDNDPNTGCQKLYTMGFRRALNIAVSGGPDEGLAVTIHLWETASASQLTEELRFGKWGDASKPWDRRVELDIEWARGMARAGEPLPVTVQVTVDGDDPDGYVVDARLGEWKGTTLRRKGRVFAGEIAIPESATSPVLLEARARSGGLQTDWVGHEVDIAPSKASLADARRSRRRKRTEQLRSARAWGWIGGGIHGGVAFSDGRGAGLLKADVDASDSPTTGEMERVNRGALHQDGRISIEGQPWRAPSFGLHGQLRMGPVRAGASLGGFTGMSPRPTGTDATQMGSMSGEARGAITISLFAAPGLPLGRWLSLYGGYGLDFISMTGKGEVVDEVNPGEIDLELSATSTGPVVVLDVACDSLRESVLICANIRASYALTGAVRPVGIHAGITIGYGFSRRRLGDIFRPD